jgi:hypothetical protein
MFLQYKARDDFVGMDMTRKPDALDNEQARATRVFYEK